jgi:hypothetical protein
MMHQNILIEKQIARIAKLENALRSHLDKMNEEIFRQHCCIQPIKSRFSVLEEKRTKNNPMVLKKSKEEP